VINGVPVVHRHAPPTPNDARQRGSGDADRRPASRKASHVDRQRKAQEVLLGSRRLGQPEAVAEAGGWSVLLPGTPIAADGADLDEALDEFVSALREYAEDWVARLRFAPNHGQHWPLVQFVSLSSDAEIAEWARGSRQ